MATIGTRSAVLSGRGARRHRRTDTDAELTRRRRRTRRRATQHRSDPSGVSGIAADAIADELARTRDADAVAVKPDFAGEASLAARCASFARMALAFG